MSKPFVYFKKFFSGVDGVSGHDRSNPEGQQPKSAANSKEMPFGFGVVFYSDEEVFTF